MNACLVSEQRNSPREFLSVVDAVLTSVARRVPLHVSREDLASAGKLALVEALLRFEDESAGRPLRPGDWLHIAPHRRHRVEATAANTSTVWLALHFPE